MGGYIYTEMALLSLFSLANCCMGLVLTPRELEGGFDISLGCSVVVEYGTVVGFDGIHAGFSMYSSDGVLV